MNRNQTMIFVTGMVAGASSAAVLLKSLFNNRLDEEAQAIHLEYKSYIENLEAEIEQLETELAFDREEEDTNPVSKEADPKPKKKKSQGKKTEIPKYNYNEIIRKLNYGEFDDAETEAPTEDDQPYILSPEDYFDDRKYEKKQIMYFEDDGTFCDAEENIIPEGMQIVGEKNLDHVGEFEDGVIYIRNEQLGCDYEVIFEDGTYSAYTGEEE